ncbi:hypothetical protein WJX72_003230 [[Myrmecia] bisecta]|uniref:ATPase domain-containing protein n=1 Tax=[Myrmecia] bisecta TaxID=41462 RepID=A0AAW1Q1S5_9CHLO
MFSRRVLKHTSAWPCTGCSWVLTRFGYQVLMSSPSASEASYELVGAAETTKDFCGGREVEITALKEMWQHRPTAMTLLTGPEGCGMSTLLRKVVKQIRDDPAARQHLMLLNLGEGAPKSAKAMHAMLTAEFIGMLDAFMASEGNHHIAALNQWLAVSLPNYNKKYHVVHNDPDKGSHFKSSVNAWCTITLREFPDLLQFLRTFFEAAKGVLLPVIVIDEVQQVQQWPEEARGDLAMALEYLAAIGREGAGHVLLATTFGGFEFWLRDKIGGAYRVATLGYLAEPVAMEFFITQCLPEVTKQLAAESDWSKIYVVCGGSPRLLRVCAINTDLGSWEAALARIVSDARQDVLCGSIGLLARPASRHGQPACWSRIQGNVTVKMLGESNGVRCLANEAHEMHDAQLKLGRIHLRRHNDLRGRNAPLDIPADPLERPLLTAANPAEYYVMRRLVQDGKVWHC